MTKSPCPLFPDPRLLKYARRNDVAVEDFGDRSLALCCDTLELREVNGAGRKILELVDGKRTVADIARTTEMADADVGEALRDMAQQGIVRQVVEWNKEKPGDMSEAKYMADPDVSFRPEDGEGGILYNAGTDALEVINPTASEIWKLLAAPRTKADVVAHLLDVCDCADREQVERDVAEFLESMRSKGFVGVVEEPA